MSSSQGKVRANKLSNIDSPNVDENSYELMAFEKL